MPHAIDNELTIRKLWTYMGFRTDAGEVCSCPNWPPDVFGLCAAVLKKSGGYTSAVSPSFRHTVKTRSHVASLQETGRSWRKALEHTLEAPLPKDVARSWAELVVPTGGKAGIDVALFRLLSEPAICRVLLDLLTIADEASAGVGLPSTRSYEREDKDRNVFDGEAERTLFPTQFGSTLCKKIHPSAARVLPKMHTAQSGLTIRSFSHNLAFCEADEVRPTWLSVPGARGDATDTSRLNILIAPWPRKLTPAQISEVRHDRQHCPYDAFDVDIKGTGGVVAEQLAALAEQARALVGPIDAVILPELAMTTRDHRLARLALLRKGIMMIAGVGSKERAANYLTMDIPISRFHALHLRQRKHHRWKLDESQINQYHLGSRLQPQKQYWENIDVQDRQLRFVVLRPWLVATALICEDLARHDPVGDLIKGVGPNLVIALLMDGPQLAQRWPGRYATALADDPGCSVLSLTSLGMALLSRSRSSDRKPSRIVALWKDAFSGVLTEIELPESHDGVVLTLVVRQRGEITADGRGDNGAACYPSLAGTHPVKLPDVCAPLDDTLKLVQWISPLEASTLALLAQQPRQGSGFTDALHRDFMPPTLNTLQGSAFHIGREIWRRKTRNFDVLDENKYADAGEIETAAAILNWDATNRNKDPHCYAAKAESDPTTIRPSPSAPQHYGLAENT